MYKEGPIQKKNKVFIQLKQLRLEVAHNNNKGNDGQKVITLKEYSN